MSSPKQEGDHLKAGHPPAVKAGGMRIKGAKVHEEKLSKEEIESPWESGVVEQKSPSSVLVSGAVCNPHEYQVQAVKAAHEKPQPTAVKPVPNKQINRVIQQPR